MTAREELAAVLAEVIEAHARRADLMLLTHATWAAEVTRSLLASPTLARVIQEAKAEAWDEGFTRGFYDVLAGGDRDASESKADNPYRDQTEEPT